MCCNCSECVDFEPNHVSKPEVSWSYWYFFSCSQHRYYWRRVPAGLFLCTVQLYCSIASILNRITRPKMFFSWNLFFVFAAWYYCRRVLRCGEYNVDLESKAKGKVYRKTDHVAAAVPSEIWCLLHNTFFINMTLRALTRQTRPGRLWGIFSQGASVLSHADATDIYIHQLCREKWPYVSILLSEQFLFPEVYIDRVSLSWTSNLSVCLSELFTGTLALNCFL